MKQDINVLLSVSVDGNATIVSIPDHLKDFIDGCMCEDNGFRNIPTEPGFYLCHVTFIGNLDEDGIDTTFTVLEAKRIEANPRDELIADIRSFPFEKLATQSLRAIYRILPHLKKVGEE